MSGPAGGPVGPDGAGPVAARLSVRLDALRGVAAVLVVLGHVRERFVALHGLDYSPLIKVALLPTAYAQESVAVFFVLSGYLVGGQVLRQVRTDRFSWRTFLAKRFSRLWTVLLPGLALTAAVDAVTRAVSPAATAIALDGSDDGWRTALCNAAFLAPARCRPFGTNASLWSLAYEFWFYLLFAAVAWGCARGHRRAWRATVTAAVVAGSLTAFGPIVLVYAVTWLLGVVVAETSRRWPVSRGGPRGIVVVLGVLVATMTATSLAEPSQALQLVIIGLVAAPLLHLVLTDERLARTAPSWPVAACARTGAWSYSLYVFHFPLVTLVLVVLPGAVAARPAGFAAMVYAVAAAASVACWALSLVTERHTARFRDLLLHPAAARSRRVPTPA